MRTYVTNRKDMAASYRLKMLRVTPALRACNGRRTARIARARKQIMETKLYQRSGNPRLTRNLINSERVAQRGNVSEILNSASYAQRRNDEEGRSVTYGHDKELHFAEGAIAETRAENLLDTRATMRGVMRP